MLFPRVSYSQLCLELAHGCGIDHTLRANMEHESLPMMPVNLKEDLEGGDRADAHLINTTVKNITWSAVSVTVKDRETKQPKTIVDHVEGIVQAGM